MHELLRIIFELLDDFGFVLWVGEVDEREIYVVIVEDESGLQRRMIPMSRLWY